MSNISSIYSGIKTQVQAALGVNFVELTHIIELDKNNFQVDTRWGVLPVASGEVNTTVGTNSLAQGFKIVLTSGYISSEYDDSGMVTKLVDLIGQLETVYKQLVNSKCGSVDVVNLGGLQVNEALVWSEKKVLLVEASFLVTSRVSLR